MFSEGCLFPLQLCMLFVNSNWMWLYVWKQSTCVWQKNANVVVFCVLVLFYGCYGKKMNGTDGHLFRLSGQGHWLARRTKHFLAFSKTKNSNIHPPTAPRLKKGSLCKKRAMQASDACFWLAHCTPSETLTFLQGLHLELVSCSGWAAQRRSLAQLSDWARLSLYGPQDGWNCQICQSLADIFKPEHKARPSSLVWNNNCQWCFKCS